ncbi:hypothetical protein, partial [Microbacterium sp. BF1]|uniref:hypothetical protein n=1 Tax=Microbacterium sp. BF1 TaxID=2821146 RepID=UPI001C4E2BF5
RRTEARRRGRRCSGRPCRRCRGESATRTASHAELHSNGATTTVSFRAATGILAEAIAWEGVTDVVTAEHESG